MTDAVTAGAVIVAAGRSRRMAGEDKLWAPLPNPSGRSTPLIAHAVTAFQHTPRIECVALVVSSDAMERARAMVQELRLDKVSAVVPGGARRQDSVLAGLRTLDHCSWVVVHDGARPLVTHALIACGLDAAQETGASCSAIPVPDTVKESADGRIVQTLDRSRLWLAQTPQTFRYQLLLDAHAQARGDVTDDATLVEALGVEVRISQGSPRNMKVTTQDDLAIVRALLA